VIRKAPASWPSGAVWLLFILALAVLLAGCGPEESEAKPPPLSERTLTLAYVEWDESVAISYLTKVLLEERTDHGNVELKEVEPEAAYRGVADGEYDAFLDVWLPNHSALLEGVEGEVATMNSWLIGTTRSSLAAPSYMNARTLEGARSTDAERVIGVRAGGAPLSTPDVVVPSDVLSKYGLENDFDYPDEAAMLDEVDRLYENREPFLFLAWTPHRMNERYEFDYVEDPEGELTELTRPARPHMIARNDLIERDPLAHALIDAILMTESQATSLQLAIQKAGDPQEGVKVWAKTNKKLTEGWIESARNRISEEDR
jgi:glycine betaine/proline transport system substrate-binding protein